ncbi:Trafficking protein particle complex subunit 12 [Dissophora globulifera]|uniref:Trafficking protein particle complex subunit 12 n=1 Tax=Dissophora globulifera TaxID=979702 RepID=A0A9P6RRD4_9FUNG|nr:Trafficking protein particle complex subunit 12 [Dissophora globulifera]
MSRNLPFEDPLLHPPTPPINSGAVAQVQQQTSQAQQSRSLQVDDGPIPFQTSSALDNLSVFSPPPLTQQPPPPPPRTTAAEPVTTLPAAGTRSASVTGNTDSGFVDPLTAAALEHQDDPSIAGAGFAASRTTPTTRGPSPNITIPAGHNSIPTEFPTHMTSPPLPQRPLSIGGTTFTAFQAFSSALQTPAISDTPASSTFSASSTSVAGDISSLSLVESVSESVQRSVTAPLAQESSMVGLGLDGHEVRHIDNESPAGGHQWSKRLSVGVSTNPSGISLQDHSDMVRQDLKSPIQEHAPSDPLQGIPQDAPQQIGDRSNTQVNISSVESGREYPTGVRSPGFAVPQSPMRTEGFPVLNIPNMFHEITSTDAMNDLMVRHVPAEQRVLRDWNALTEAEQRQASRAEILHELTINNSWRAMARYTRSQILATPTDRIPELVNLWYARLLALVKLGEYDMAQAELDQLGELHGPQYRYENYPAEMFISNSFQTQEQQRNGALRKGSMVPFEMFVLKARLQGHLGDIYEAIDQLYDLIINCKKFEAICRVSEDSVGEQQWQHLQGQLHLMVLNYLVELKDFPTATKHGRELARKYPQDVNFHSGLGRLYLQLGDLERAEEVFKGVEDMIKKDQETYSGEASDSNQTHYKLQLSMNRALLAVTQGQWVAAKTAFEEVLAQEPENLAASNNLAVVELYAGQLNEAIPRMERLMFAYPTSAGASEPLVFNMATLYELRTEGSLRKKQQMMAEVCKWAGDQFNVSMFKI